MKSQIREETKMEESMIDRAEIWQKRTLLTQTYKFPASKKLALWHSEANKFGNNSGFQNQICSCCLKGLNNQPLPLCQTTTPNLICGRSTPSESEFPLSSGASMFFFFIKMSILFILLHLIVIDGFNIITSLRNHDGSDSSQWIRFSILEKPYESDEIVIVELLSMVMMILSIIYFIIIQKIKYHIYLTLDISKQTEDDYAILVENIPIIGNLKGPHAQKIKIDYDKKLEEFFTYKVKKWLGDKTFWYDEEGNVNEGNAIEYDYVTNLRIKPDYEHQDIVKSLCLCHNIDRIQKVDELREQLMAEHHSSFEEIKYVNKMIEKSQDREVGDEINVLYVLRNQHQAKLDHYVEQIQLMNQAQMFISEEMSTNHAFIYETTHFVGSAFISFKYQHFRDKILQWADMNFDPKKEKSLREREWEKSEIFSMDFEGNTLRISEAPNPTEVLWGNFSLSEHDRKLRRLFSLILIGLVLLFSFLIILFINIGAGLMETMKDKILEIFKISVSILISLVILVVNQALYWIIYKVIYWERHKTISSAKYSLVKKLVASYFINSALIYFSVAFITVYLQVIPTDKKMAGRILVDQISVLFLTSGLTSIAFNLLNIPDLLRRATIWWFYTSKGEKKDSNSDSYYNTFQIKLNQAFEYPEFDIASRYSYYIAEIYSASFYAYLVPIVFPILLLTFFSHYWIDKLNLYKRSSYKFELSNQLTGDIFSMLKRSVLIYSIGMFIFSTEIHSGVRIFPLITLILSFFFVLISDFLPRTIFKALFQSYNFWEKYSYDDNVKAEKFMNTFWNRNPVTYLLNQNAVTKRRKPKNYGTTQLNCTGADKKILLKASNEDQREEKVSFKKSFKKSEDIIVEKQLFKKNEIEIIDIIHGHMNTGAEEEEEEEAMTRRSGMNFSRRK